MPAPWHGTARLLLIAAPGTIALVLVLFAGVPDVATCCLLLAIVVALSVVAAHALRGTPAGWTRTLANLVEALREGDYSVRAWSAGQGDDYGSLVDGFNRLAAHLQDERRGLHETLQLLSKTLATLDGAVFAFEGDGRLRMVNPAGERLMGLSAVELLGRDPDRLDLKALFSLPSGSIHAQAFPGQTGRWQVSHASLRSRSQAGSLLVLQPMERALREEEALAFRRLLRVISHEINNSLAPIVSMADTMQRLMPAAATTLDAERRIDLVRGLEIIEQRSSALQRFLGGYAQLARLPPPRPKVFPVDQLCRRVEVFLGDPRIDVDGDPDQRVCADEDQLEQVLINLLRNALEADSTGRAVSMRWHRTSGSSMSIQVLDSGQGLPTSDSLFVPFFTTKPNGSGIGLVLSRQIVEAQGGTLVLQARDGEPGTAAIVMLPSASG
jgi:nitrogen fixation/metabolism regulation signal transduction histidine kinase